MRSFSDMISVGLVALAAFAGSAAAYDDGCEMINGLTYCKSVDQITYKNIGFSGSYDEVVGGMKHGGCEKQKKTFSGSLAPLDEQLSVHIRGPIALKKFAVYYPPSSPWCDKKDKRAEHFHAHRRHHKRTPGGHRRKETDRNTYKRVGYYNAEKEVSDGLVFLNHKGGAQSGVWDGNFGNSLSYADSDGTGCAAEPTILKDTVLPSDNEFVIFSDEKCRGDECGYYRPGIPAYRGFDGKEKVFLFEFKMPKDAEGGRNSYKANFDLPAIWMLNAKIPRTEQYGDCSCWQSGCGEMDLFEAIKGAPDYLKSHYHSKQGQRGGYGGGGSPDYFKRPCDSFIKGAAIYKKGKVVVKYLPDDFKFGSTINLGDLLEEAPVVSSFDVPS